MTAPITRVQRGTNAELIATAQALYPMDGFVIDLTPGPEEGLWAKHRPERLTSFIHGDFRRVGTGYAHPGGWDHVVFDPPYVAKGGHATSTIGEMNERYGMLHVERNPELQWSRQIVPGIAEAHRLLADDGLLWFKCMDYVTGGKVHWVTKRALPLFDATGWFTLVDEFILDGHTGPQPLTDKCKACAGSGLWRQPIMTTDQSAVLKLSTQDCATCDGTGKVPRRQVHARNAHSVLMIARKR